MKIVDALSPSNSISSSIVSVGNFDGVHCGHSILIREVAKRAQRKGVASVVVTFEPHTRYVLSPGYSMKLLSTLEEKSLLIQQLGIDYLAVVPFNSTIAEMPAEEFVQRILVGNLKAKEWIMGESHTFGKGGKGNINLLRSKVAKNHFSIFKSKLFFHGQNAISSTEIRKKIILGEMAEAIQMLGHPYLICATRMQGAHRGRHLGYPTLNFAVPSENKVIPPPGVYAAKLQNEKVFFKGALYYGKCPTFGNEEPRLEFHAFLKENETIEIQERGLLWVHERIRGDFKFDAPQQLVVQIEKDIREIKNIFSQEL